MQKIKAGKKEKGQQGVCGRTNTSFKCDSQRKPH